MSREFDICAIDAGQTRVRYLIFHDGKTVLSGQTDQGITTFMAHRSNAGLGGYRGDSGEAGAVGAEYPDLIEPVFFDSSVAIRRDDYPLVVSSLPGSKSMISIKVLHVDQHRAHEFQHIPLA